jgi:hypothetical protein
MIKDISNRLLRDFATCLQSRLAEQPAPAVAGETGGQALAGDAEPDRVVAAPAPDATAGEQAATLHPGGGPRATSEFPAATPPAPAKPVNALSLFFGALLDRLKRLFGRS